MFLIHWKLTGYLALLWWHTLCSYSFWQWFCYPVLMTWWISLGQMSSLGNFISMPFSWSNPGTVMVSHHWWLVTDGRSSKLSWQRVFIGVLMKHQLTEIQEHPVTTETHKHGFVLDLWKYPHAYKVTGQNDILVWVNHFLNEISSLKLFSEGNIIKQHCHLKTEL